MFDGGRRLWYVLAEHTFATKKGRAMRIDCDDCAMQHTAACDDCIVTALLDRRPDHAVVFSLEEERAIRALQRGGLAPQNRFLPIDRAVPS